MNAPVVDPLAAIAAGDPAIRRSIYANARTYVREARTHVEEAKAFERAAKRAEEEDDAPKAALLLLRAACAYVLVVIELDWAIYWRDTARLDRDTHRRRAAMLRGRLS